MTVEMKQENRPSQQRKALNAGIAGGIMGIIGGVLIGYSLDYAWQGAIIGGLLIGAGEAFFDWKRKPGEMKPFAWRLLVSTFLGAALGALWGLLFPDLSLIFLGFVLGLFSGILGLSWKRIRLGLWTGLVLSTLAVMFYPELQPAILGALIVFFYRVQAAIFYRGEEAISLAAERVPADEIRYVVPFTAHSGYIGADYFKDLARTEEGEFKRNAPGAGIVETMETMRGPHFDPDLVDPLIREFYEHTTRFKLSIIPEWNRWMRPVFWLYKQMVARQIGQANLPFNQEEAQRGVVSYIDTIDFQCDDIIDLRGWVRAFEATGEAIYVGVYTTFRHENVGYVSVGFPLPESNFTATLLPNNHAGSNFLLNSRDTGFDYPGHYLSTNEDGELTVLALPGFNEEIEVYVADGQLRTDHRFYLGDQVFLTLLYKIERA
jgi:hypothetical protein